MSLTGTPAKVNGEWGGVRVAKGVGQPGAVVTVQTKAGKTWTKQLVGVAQSYDDSDIWTAEDVGSNGSSPAPSGPPAAPAPQQAPASTGPAGPGGGVKASDLLSAALSAYVEATTGPAQVPDEQAGSIACTIAIQVGRGAVNDLPDLDPFAG